MSKILVVGNSVEVVNYIKALRQQDTSSSVTLFCTESVLPYSRTDLPSFLSKSIKESQLFSEHDKFFTTHQVDVVAGEVLARISLKRKYLTTESKKQISYDKLVLVDTGHYKLPDIKGSQKNGVFHALSLKSIKELAKTLIDVETVVVNVTNFQGLNTACALSALKKEVLITSPLGLLSHVFDDETSSLLKQIVEAKGIRVVEQEIEEILGDSQVKAVRLKSGKVIGVQAVVVDDPGHDLSMLSEDQLPEDVTQLKEGLFNALQLPLMPVTFGQQLFDGYAVGVTCLPEGGREYLRFNGPDNVFKKIYVLGDNIVGAVLFNAHAFIQPITQVMCNQENISGREEALLEA